MFVYFLVIVVVVGAVGVVLIALISGGVGMALGLAVSVTDACGVVGLMPLASSCCYIRSFHKRRT